jgi:uncharacterized protein YbjT (DUF2867 family)
MMFKTKPTILVVSGNSKVSGAIITRLLDKGWPVRTTVRTLDSRSDHLKSLGVEVVKVK